MRHLFTVLSAATALLASTTAFMDRSLAAGYFDQIEASRVAAEALPALAVQKDPAAFIMLAAASLLILGRGFYLYQVYRFRAEPLRR